MQKIENARGEVGKLLLCLATLVLMMPLGANAVINICGSLTNGYGPYDYTDPDQKANKLPIVEGAHFTEEVEEGIKGATGLLGGDLDYTLRAFPNHHRALASLARIALRDKAVQIPGAKYPVECYFVRAIRFKPTDGAVHASYGNYLFALGKSDRALDEFKRALQLDPENAGINYNLGLIYLKAKNYEQANAYANKAYALGFPLQGLKNMLIEAGKWEGPKTDGKPAEKQVDEKHGDQADNIK
jgi:tetratricopeptide (TPR) repeat protein